MGGTNQLRRWAIILAGGNGTRLLPLTQTIVGDERPKQFCPILGRETLLEQTRQRTALIIPPDRTFVVVLHAHQRFYAPLLADQRGGTLVVQPSNRGTAPAILLSLLRLAAVAPLDAAAIFPSDHYVADDEVFMAHVEAAFHAVQSRPDMLILLGITADSPEVGYGWIEPATPIWEQGAYTIYRVRRFWGKPSAALAQNLLTHGCLWNSLVMIACVPTLLTVIRKALHDLYYRFAAIQPALNTRHEGEAVRALYAQLPPTNFSDEVLGACPANLAVLPVHGTEWSDWGEPHRIIATLARRGVHPAWAERTAASSA